MVSQFYYLSEIAPIFKGKLLDFTFKAMTVHDRRYERYFIFSYIAVI